MTDENSGSAGRGRPGSRPRREPVTLDQKPLSVTIAPEDAPSPASDAGAAGAATPDAGGAFQPSDAGTPVSGDAVSAQSSETLAETLAAPSAEPASESPAEPAVEPARETPDAGGEPPLRDDAPSPPPPAPTASRGGWGAVVVALIAGGVAGAAAGYGLPLLLNPESAHGPRLAALEQSLADAASRTEARAVSHANDAVSRLDSAVSSRVAALEERLDQFARRQEEGVTAFADGAAAPLQGDIDTLRTEIARIDESLTASGGAVDDATRRITELGERIGGVEETIAARVKQLAEAEAGLNERIAGLEETVKAQPGRAGFDRLSSTVETQAGDIARLATRVLSSENATAEAERRVQAAGTATGERVLVVARLAVLERLGQALTRGQPFQAELDTLSRLGVGAVALSPLLGASGGIATPASLVPGFAAAANAFPVDDLPADAGIVDRLMVSASRIVRITPVDGEADPSSIAGQVEAALRRNDAAAALAAWNRLPEGARAQTAALAEALQKRVAADKALAELTQAQVNALDAPAAAPGQGG